MKTKTRWLEILVAAVLGGIALVVLLGRVEAQKLVAAGSQPASVQLPGLQVHPPSNPFIPHTAFLPAVTVLRNQVADLKNNLLLQGFSITDGKFMYEDLVKDTCEGKLQDTLANNPWPNTYVTLAFGQIPPPQSMFWQLGENDAVIMVGQTPPPARYFSYQTFMIKLPGSSNRIGAAVGDAINIGTVQTSGPDKFRQPIIYVITGNTATEQRVRQAALAAGYPASIINVETISPIIGPMGYGPTGSVFAFAHRIAAAENQDDLFDYVQNANKYYTVFRIQAGTDLAAQLAGHPQPVPALRVRGTGQTEMDLYPTLKKLRQAILAENASRSLKELDSKIWTTITPDGRELTVEKPYTGLQRGIQVIGGTRDTNYLATYPYFRLRQGVDEFVMVYGVNHQQTNKVTYTSFSIYADSERYFGLKDGTITSPNYGESAKRYLCPDDQNCDPNWQDFYAWKVARDCQGEEFCMTVNDQFVDINGESYTCNRYDWYANPSNPPLLGPLVMDESDLFFVWRSYMEPATKVGPDDNELLYDRAIYFGDYFNP
jgi:hypothetical protein